MKHGKYNAAAFALGNQSRMRKGSRSTSEFEESHTKQFFEDEDMEHTLKNQSRTNALITDLQKTDYVQPI